MIKKPFPEVIRKYLGMKHRSGAMGENGEIGCMGLIYSILRDLGKNVPDSFNGIRVDNYQDYEESHTHKERYDLLIEICSVIGTPICPGSEIVGDLILCKTRKEEFFPAIYTGNGNAVTCFVGLGVRVFPLKFIQEVVIVRRF